MVMNYGKSNMKTQSYGSYSGACSLEYLGILAWYWSMSVGGFEDARKNGNDDDKPKNLDIKYDGKYTWIKGEVKEDDVYGIKNKDGDYEFEVRYDAGPEDLAYFEAMDRNYLARILKEGKLKELEPEVWRLYDYECSGKINIGEWWSQKLKLPNIGAILENAEAYCSYHEMLTFWSEVPDEICKLIAEDFVSDTVKKLEF
jgi:hypothetical protein